MGFEISYDAAAGLQLQWPEVAALHGAPIRVAVHAASGGLSVVVENGPPRDTATGLEDAGGTHGINGLRDRLAVVGGELRAGPTRDGGWRLTAELPTN